MRHCADFGCQMNSAGYCPRCDGPQYGYGRVELPLSTQGCICPAGANVQCQNPICPRKPIPSAAGTFPATASDKE